MTNAIGWSSVLNGFSGKNSKPIHYSELLPYQDEFDEAGRQLSRYATGITLRLIKENKLPIAMVQQLAKLKEISKEI